MHLLTHVCLVAFLVFQDWVCSFEKPQTSPNSLSPSTTVLSPYVTFGCLSARTFWWRLSDVYKGVRVAMAVLISSSFRLNSRTLKGIFVLEETLGSSSLPPRPAPVERVLLHCQRWNLPL